MVESRYGQNLEDVREVRGGQSSLDDQGNTIFMLMRARQSGLGI